MFVLQGAARPAAEVRAPRRAGRGLPEERLLELYLSRIDETDVELEVPDWQDPAVAASLIAEDAMARGRNTVYVTGDELVDPALTRFDAMPGVRAVRLHGARNPLRDLVAYHNAQALGVLGFSSYFGATPRIDPADLVVLDAGRMPEGLVGSLFMVRVDRRLQPQAYGELRALLGRPDPGRRGVKVIEPPEWARVAGRAAELLTGLLCGNETQFVWLRLQPFLRDCEVVVRPDDIEIRPPHRMLRALPGYRHAGQRVHLGAASGARAAGEDAGGPERPETAALSPSVRYAVDYLRARFADPDLTLNQVAHAVYVSRYHLSRSFRDQTGQRFIDFVTMLRMNEARFLLRETDTSITDIARAVGYRELSHFQRTFKKRFGMSASGYRAEAQRRELDARSRGRGLSPV
ncbi:helix-turn-helix transcriptional regulator [Bailinhaonella thermotolerans]|uniref:AraC family transcriptional regulator n=1 Tax=Bailinhaonella thermotolerans TaxID=1070861 RepID=A0A3A4B7X9_9ACTN|nr:helix-turn-helix transcriptional regulator [Bailinhaonella thermotolerans]RJL34341.1 AraC family transcriptional regulator [Bailinhaonella thermotolerans]